MDRIEDNVLIFFSGSGSFGCSYTEEAIVTKIHVSLFLLCQLRERRGMGKNVDCRRGVWTMRGVCTDSTLTVASSSS